MDSKELKLKSKSELENLLKELRDRLGTDRFNQTNKSKDTSQVGKTKKDIARILTILKSDKPLT